MATVETRRKFTADKFLQMAEQGIIGEEDRVELLDGEIIEMSPIGSDHTTIVVRLTSLLVPRLLQKALVLIQNSIRIDEHSLPEPDVTVVRWRSDYYKSGLPTPADILLIVEVAHTSLAYDRLHKLPKYAETGVPELWIVDVEGKKIEQFSQPRERTYQQRREFAHNQTITSVSIPELQLATNDILG